MKTELSWSLIDPKPVIKYVPQCDDYIVLWNGIILPHKMALCFAMTKFGIYATPEMKRELEKNYRKLYYANAFQTRKWDGVMDDRKSVFSYLNNVMTTHVNDVTEKYTAQEVLSWFDYSRAVMSSD